MPDAAGHVAIGDQGSRRAHCRIRRDRERHAGGRRSGEDGARRLCIRAVADRPAYTALVAAAQAAGEAEIRACCERILQQERDMAAWLLRHLPELTTAFLDRSAVDRIDAKR
nr:MULTISPECIES: DUF892 family protein [Burkholderia cepacia complex]